MYTVTYYPVSGTTTNTYHNHLESTAYPRVWKKVKLYQLLPHGSLQFWLDDGKLVILNGNWTVEEK